jgi:hypothetical protein
MMSAISLVLLLLALVGCAAAPSAPALPATPATPSLPATHALPSTPASGVPAQMLSFATLRPDTRAAYAKRANEGGNSYGLDPARSDIRIYAFRAGLGARFGHNHVLTVPRFSGLAWIPAQGLRGATADFGFRLSDLTVDPPALRAETGGGFAGTLGEADIRGTLEHLLGEQGFQAVSFPWIEVHAEIETGELPIAIADVALSLHGETHHQRVVLRVLADAQAIEASGTLAFRQGDFGLKPYAVMGGLLAVDELVAVEFRLRGGPLAPGSL